MTIDFPEMFDIPAPWNLQERSDHKIQREFFGTHFALLRSPSSLVFCSALLCRDIAPQPEDQSFAIAARPRSMEKLPMDVAVQIASRVATAAADPMEDLGSLRATCS
jgi:hypothetical protein